LVFGLDWLGWLVIGVVGLDEGLRAGAWVRLAYSHHKTDQVK